MWCYFNRTQKRWYREAGVAHNHTAFVPWARLGVLIHLSLPLGSLSLKIRRRRCPWLQFYLNTTSWLLLFVGFACQVSVTSFTYFPKGCHAPFICSSYFKWQPVCEDACVAQIHLHGGKASRDCVLNHPQAALLLNIYRINYEIFNFLTMKGWTPSEI